MQLAFKVLNIFRITCHQNQRNIVKPALKFVLGLSTCILGMLIFFQRWKILKWRMHELDACTENYICSYEPNRNKRRLAWSDLSLYVYVDAKMYVIVKICLVFD